MARVLIVGCGCRGRALAARLIAEGHAVRGTSRDPARVAAIAAAGAEAAVADPDRLATLIPQLSAVTVICWLMASATGDGAKALHEDRLRSLLERLVDTPVRGLVYEAAGRAEPRRLRAGADAVRAAAITWRLRVATIEQDPGDPDAWVDAASAAVARVLAP